jgi:cytochrome P450
MSLPIGPFTEEWCSDHFDFTAPELGDHLYEVLGHMRAHCPVARTDAHGGQCLATRYRNVLEVAQDWRTFSNVSYGGDGPPVPLLPITIDPPLHTFHRRIVNSYFTPAAMGAIEDATRHQARRLIDNFVDTGACEFMEEFARPFPGLVLFHEIIHAPVDEIEAINEMATNAGIPGHPKEAEGWMGMVEWVGAFVTERRKQPSRGDVVDAIIGAEIDGDPLSDPEICGTLVLLIMGGLETTAGSLGHFFIRFAHRPDIPAMLRDQPELIPRAIEELIRLDVPFLHLQRRVASDAQIGGQKVRQGERVLISLAAANRDEDEFADPDEFILDRPKNRQIAFGVGPHRCVGSNLARMNLRVALEELLPRLDNIQLQQGSELIRYHNAFNRAPLTVPITFTPGS